MLYRYPSRIKIVIIYKNVFINLDYFLYNCFKSFITIKEPKLEPELWCSNRWSTEDSETIVLLLYWSPGLTMYQPIRWSRSCCQITRPRCLSRPSCTWPAWISLSRWGKSTVDMSRETSGGVTHADCWNWSEWGLKEYKWKGPFFG